MQIRKHPMLRSFFEELTHVTFQMVYLRRSFECLSCISPNENFTQIVKNCAAGMSEMRKAKTEDTANEMNRLRSFPRAPRPLRLVPRAERLQIRHPRETGFCVG
jgi:hypothetical protein